MCCKIESIVSWGPTNNETRSSMCVCVCVCDEKKHENEWKEIAMNKTINKYLK